MVLLDEQDYRRGMDVLKSKSKLGNSFAVQQLSFSLFF